VQEEDEKHAGGGRAANEESVPSPSSPVPVVGNGHQLILERLDALQTALNFHSLGGRHSTVSAVIGTSDQMTIHRRDSDQQTALHHRMAVRLIAARHWQVHREVLATRLLCCLGLLEPHHRSRLEKTVVLSGTDDTSYRPVTCAGACCSWLFVALDRFIQPVT
jgi:hypothetical protein